jgi:folate-binding protein YgfZ
MLDGRCGEGATGRNPTLMANDLEEALRARGAVFDVFHGVNVARHFGDVGREWRAAREGAGVFAAGFRSLIGATGEDRVSFLQGMLSNDVKALAPGQGTYAAMLTQQGRVVADLRVYAQPERLLLDVVAWRRAALQEALERYLVADDVELAAPEEELVVGVEGPLARAVVGEALGGVEPPRIPYAHVAAEFQGARVLLITASEVDGEGVLLAATARSAAALFDACVEAGARPLGMQALDILRVEAGVPWAGIDIDEDTLIMETGRAAAISFSKGCYLGQEVVERIAARGHVNRGLAGILCTGDGLPAPGARLLADGHEVGYVTSAVRSEALSRGIGLAMIQRKHSTAGEQLTVDTGAAPMAVTVAPLPFPADTSD